VTALVHSYELPAAILLVIGGAIACFAGYRLFRMVLAIYGFVFGAMIAIATIAPKGGLAMLVTAVLGGVAGTLILAVAYFVGIALVGAGLGAMIAHAGWSYARGVDPPAAAVIALTLAGAIGAMMLQKYMTVVSTAFGGGWTMIVGGLAIASARGPASMISASEMWIPYPLVPTPARPWVPVAWLVLGLMGTAVQVGVTGRKKKR
jgi:hypothetical protein